ncbi:uncharacterized protein LOC105386856 [Plutella xylostella]|uniref:uncharacterized protein LOC105386856 n=1 Tax=Plutella xylostella TaxID=51655 RepID=UPI0005D06DCD|nr:uncharacterized protein LOC105386856 [Plutella xylostella]
MSATVESTWKSKISNNIEIPNLTRCCFCVPLRRGLVAFAYANLVLTLVVCGILSYYISYLRLHGLGAAEFPRLVADTAALVIETVMTIVFIVALHKKHVTLMKIYLHFEIVFSFVGFLYSLAFLTNETASELFLILFQLTLQIYLAILIWSLILKMQRDGTVKYVREDA